MAKTLKISMEDALYIKSMGIKKAFKAPIRFDAYGKVHHTGVDVTLKDSTGCYGLFAGGLLYN